MREERERERREGGGMREGEREGKREAGGTGSERG